MRLKSFFAALFLFMPLALSAAQEYTVGTDYREISPPVPTEGTPGKVQVWELFWYGCPHCFQMEPAVQSWLKKKPADVEFVRIPAVFNRAKPDGTLSPWFIDAKAYYAAQALGVGEKMHPLLFRAIHEQHRSLGTEDELAAFFAENGVPAKDFKAAFESFAVETKAVHAIDLSKSSGITGVPSIIIDGKYHVLGQRATSYEDYFAIADYLIGRERTKR